MTKTLKRSDGTYGTTGSRLDFRLVACAYPKCGRTGRVRLWTGDGRAVAFRDMHALYVGTLVGYDASGRHEPTSEDE
ncbi:MAG: hypothetical protein C4340_07075 [Armatimonadota bacterium]